MSRAPYWAPRFQARGLSPFRPLPCCRVSVRLGACFPRDLTAEALASHCWPHQPWMADGLVPHQPTAANSPPRSGCLVSQAMSPTSLSFVRGPSESTARYLLSPSRADAGIPTSTREGLDSIPCAQPRAPFHEPEIPSANESHLLSWLSPGHFREPPPVPWLRRQWPGFQHVFTPLPEEVLDPVAIDYSPRPCGPHAARQLLQRSAPRALQRTSRFSMGLRRTAFSPSGATLSGAHRPSILRSGVAGLFEHVDPRLGDRSPRRIYPNLTNPSTSCRVSVSLPVWKKSRNDDPAVWIPVGRKLPVCRDEPDIPIRTALRSPSRKGSP